MRRTSHGIASTTHLSLMSQSKSQSSTPQNKETKQKKSSNRLVCFLCKKEGHYGSPTSCYASTHVRKNYFN